MEGAATTTTGTGTGLDPSYFVTEWDLVNVPPIEEVEIDDDVDYAVIPDDETMLEKKMRFLKLTKTLMVHILRHESQSQYGVNADLGDFKLAPLGVPPLPKPPATTESSDDPLDQYKVRSEIVAIISRMI